MRGLHRATILLFAATGCLGGNDEATDSTSGVSIGVVDSELTGCHGQASSSIPADGKYVITTFGGPGDHQSMSCGGFADGTTWYAASRQRYGCGAKLRIEANGKCVVVEALDYGPDVCVEAAAGKPIIDASPLVTKALFGTSSAGWSEKKLVTVTQVAAATPVGTCSTQPPPPPPMTTTCFSSTLARDVSSGTCVQAASDAVRYQCQSGAWVSHPGTTGCTSSYAFCDSATLGEAVAPRTCVQAASNSVWYQCNGQAWVTPVSTSAHTGPIGACSSWNPL